MTASAVSRLSEQPWLVAGAAAGVATALWLVGRSFSRRKAAGAFPPGPPGKPIIGNLLDVPKKKEWLVYAEWAEKYGDVVGIQIPGMSIVLLNKEEDAKALFVNRSGNYSNRIDLPFLRLCNWQDALGVVSPGDALRIQRRLIGNLIGPHVVKNYFESAEGRAKEAVVRLVRQSGPVQDTIKWISAKLFLRLSYGYDVVGDKDRFVHEADDALQSFFTACEPDWTVNLVPILRYLPSWLPGMSFKRTAAQIRKKQNVAQGAPFEWAKQQIASGTAKPSFARDTLTDPDTQVDEFYVCNTLANLYIAASDTLIATSSWFLLAMTLYPEIQRRAQAELDAVIGNDRLPSLEDRPHLPYMDAVLKEVYRWNAATNTALPHTAQEDDEYKGYRFKKGTIFMANVWSILHNPIKYPDPFNFIPERHMGTLNQKDAHGNQLNEDPSHYVFGFGPRICPGRHLADAFAWVLFARLLATCNISDACYVDGTRITQDNIDSTSGVVSCPLPFTCKIIPKNAAAEALLLD